MCPVNNCWSIWKRIAVDLLTNRNVFESLTLTLREGVTCVHRPDRSTGLSDWVQTLFPNRENRRKNKHKKQQKKNSCQSAAVLCVLKQQYLTQHYFHSENCKKPFNLSIVSQCLNDNSKMQGYFITHILKENRHPPEKLLGGINCSCCHPLNIFFHPNGEKLKGEEGETCEAQPLSKGNQILGLQTVKCSFAKTRKLASHS